MSEVVFKIKKDPVGYNTQWVVNQHSHTDDRLLADATGIISFSPFGNCQIYTIGNFNCTLGYEDNHILEILNLINNSVSKTQLLIDINQSYIPRIERLFNKDEIIFKTPYVNNTGSSMVMYLLQIRRMLIRTAKENTDKTKVKK